jgi:hypothetical protein
VRVFGIVLVIVGCGLFVADLPMLGAVALVLGVMAAAYAIRS